MTSGSLDFPGILLEQCGSFQSGSLRLRQDAIVFKRSNALTNDCIIETVDLKNASWIRRSKGYCLKLIIEGPSTNNVEKSYWFDGFQEQSETRIKNYFTHYYSIPLQHDEVSLKGWNWGDVKFYPDNLMFQTESKTNFEVPLRYVTACNINKNEAALELSQEHDDQVSLMEIRFFVPPNSEADDAELDRIEQFKSKVMEGASVVTASDSDVISVLSSINCLVPRGRYDMRLYSTFVDLHGKSFDYKIPYTQIIRAFLLPHQDNRQMFFVISVDPPLKQGQTRYPFVILQFNTNDDDEQMDLLMSDELLAEKYGKDKLDREFIGARYDIVCKLFRVLADRKITVPGSYSSKSNARCVTCSFKASSGLLYPLERGLMFIHKPPIFLRLEDILNIDLGSSDSIPTSKNLKTFDIEITMRNSSRYIFSSVDREEKQLLAQFFKNKGMRVKVTDETNISSKKDTSDSAVITAHDAYVNRLKMEGEEREAMGESFDDDEDTEDEDFVGGEPSDDDDRSSSSSDIHQYHLIEFFQEREFIQSILVYFKKTKSNSDRSVQSTDKNEPSVSKKPKKTLSSKQPNKPTNRRQKRKNNDGLKRPLTAYILWLNENRSKLKEKHPSKSVKELTILAGEEWRNLQDKTKWQEAAAVAQQEYRKAKALLPANVKESIQDSTQSSN